MALAVWWEAGIFHLWGSERAPMGYGLGILRIERGKENGKEEERENLKGKNFNLYVNCEGEKT